MFWSEGYSHLYENFHLQKFPTKWYTTAENNLTVYSLVILRLIIGNQGRGARIIDRSAAAATV